jgi:hypothetical protein
MRASHKVSIGALTHDSSATIATGLDVMQSINACLPLARAATEVLLQLADASLPRECGVGVHRRTPVVWHIDLTTFMSFCLCLQLVFLGVI